MVETAKRVSFTPARPEASAKGDARISTTYLIRKAKPQFVEFIKIFKMTDLPKIPSDHMMKQYETIKPVAKFLGLFKKDIRASV
tara:strand:- start:1031 stop:1282 length:252 start_codon:yes stop_codon:yes gene_type:complete